MALPGLHLGQPRARHARWQRPATFAVLLLFWGLGLWNLDRFPPIHFDESTILQPGYQLFYDGVYGSDMYTGFYGQERIYLEVPPIMSILQGASVRLLGVGVWQMRYLPVVWGTVTLASTAALASWLVDPTVGAVAAMLAVLWQWTPAGLDFLGSGLPLLDVARIARYDILVPVFGLAAFAAWLRANACGQRRFDFLSGFLVGLAGLANVYGAFWIVALGWLTALEKGRGRASRLGWLVVGLAVPILAWLVVMAAHWDDAIGQLGKHEGRFDVLRPAFYVENLLNEDHRYFLGIHDPATYLRLGFWLVVIGLPIAMAWLAWRWLRRQDAHARWLLVPAIVLPGLLALLDSQKRFYYLIVVIPIFAIVVAWPLTVALRSGSRLGRFLLMALLLGLLAQAGLGVARLQSAARRETAPVEAFAALRLAVPASAGVILGAPQFWLAMPERRYRSMVLPFLLSVITNIKPVPYEQAMDRIAPEIVLMDSSFASNLEPDYTVPFWHYMAAHHARVIGQVPGYEGQGVTVYQLDP